MNRFMFHKIDDTMFLSQAACPSSGREVLEGFGLTDTRKRISHDRLDNFHKTKRDSPLGMNPRAKVIAELGLENSHSMGAHGSNGLIQSIFLFQSVDRPRLGFSGLGSG